MKKTIAIFLLTGILSLNAQNLVIIGEVENVKDGTEFYVFESTEWEVGIQMLMRTMGKFTKVVLSYPINVSEKTVGILLYFLIHQDF